MIRRVLVEKKEGFNEEALRLKSNINKELKISSVKDVRVINCYDVMGLDEKQMELCSLYIFSEKNVDTVLTDDISATDKTFRIKPLPGQFDQRGDSAKQCIGLLMPEVENVEIEASKIYELIGDVSDEEIKSIKSYLINPVELVEVAIEKPNSLLQTVGSTWDNPTVENFRTLSDDQMKNLKDELGLAMTADDLIHIREYFKTENRDPYLTEIMVLDTYWSDHCRHTTFMTELENIDLSELEEKSPITEALNGYLEMRKAVYDKKAETRAVNLMDMATISAKYHIKNGKLDYIDVSEEINACSININVDIDNAEEEYLLMFKNETHNHPTEIEPFGGASTCLGGAIRDPLSGRAYVYQGMRVTGAADPTESIEDTIKGKLPQRKITREAAKGFSSYGNQIGMSTGQVKEYYDDGFKAKRMEVGAVIAAAPKENVIRMTPEKGDVIMLIGGRTGRDGVGGATGSSKSHDETSTVECSAQVQKGNPPEERKLQRLFRNPVAAKMIKRCNDFGAGGVSVAVGEIADSIDIFLDRVPKKYNGLNPMEIALSESQERMAVVITESDVPKFKKLLLNENIEGTVIANVTSTGRLRMFHKGELVLDLSRDFIETSGASSRTRAKIEKVDYSNNPMMKGSNINKDENINKVLDSYTDEVFGDLNMVSQKGLVDMFDSTIGSGTVLMPFGGNTYSTPVQGMVSKVPVLKGNTNTVSIMTHGYDPKIGKWSTYHGGYYSVIDSVAKVVSLGGNVKDTVLSLQEYFQKMMDEKSWGLPVAGLLGTIDAQRSLGVSAIGGKDSMSGTFNDINVPPTIISFAVAPSKVEKIISPELKGAGSKLYMLYVKPDQNGISCGEKLLSMYGYVESLRDGGNIKSSYTVGRGGALYSMMMMAVGNKVGVNIHENVSLEDLMNEYYGGIIIETSSEITSDEFDVVLLGETTTEENMKYNGYVWSYEDILKRWEAPLEEIFPTTYKYEGKVDQKIIDEIENNKNEASQFKSNIIVNKPKVVVPIFPGTNCEWDTMRAFEKEGASVELVGIRNLNPDLFAESIDNLTRAIKEANIIAFPGGFSAGDEPDGSGKFIATIIRNPKIAEAIMEHIKVKDGLIIGICNGFQALIKTGLLPYGEIRELDDNSPTLTYNKIGRHVSSIVNTKITTKKSPWLMLDSYENNYKTPISHGEGRFVASEDVLKSLIDNGQIATVYTDANGVIAQDSAFNPNGSTANIEGIISPDGRIFGKMGHIERVDKSLYKNITNVEKMRVFEAGVKYFRG